MYIDFRELRKNRHLKLDCMSIGKGIASVKKEEKRDFQTNVTLFRKQECL